MRRNRAERLESGSRLNCCNLCEYYRTNPINKPCCTCNHRRTPLVPAKELDVYGKKYRLIEE